MSTVLIILIVCITLILISSLVFTKWILDREDSLSEDPDINSNEKCPKLKRDDNYHKRRCELPNKHYGPHSNLHIGWWK